MSNYEQNEGTVGKVRLPIGLSELLDDTKQKVLMVSLKKEVRKFKRVNVINQLAQMNTLIATNLSDTENFRKIQSLLFDNFIDEELEAKLKERFGSENTDERPLFFRQQILALLRLCILECSEEALLEPNGKTLGGFALGRCCLIMTDHLLSKKQERDISEGTSAKKRKHLAIQMAATFELNNPTKLHRALSRTDITLSQLSSLTTSKRLKQLLSGFNLKTEFRKATGLTIEQYRNFVFMVLAYYDSQKPEDLLANQDLFKLHPTNFISKSKIKQRKFNSFLALDSIKLAKLYDEMKTPRPVLPSLDFTVFRRWPLIEIAEKTLICVDPSFLLDKLGSGLFWTISNSFASQKDSSSALQGFGYLFELYVDGIMRQIFPKSSNLFISFPKFENGNESFDGIAQFNEHLIVFEYKGGTLTQKAKYSGKTKAFEDDLDLPKKFGVGKGAGVHQLVTKLEKLLHQNSEQRSVILSLSQNLSYIKKVAPVLIVREPFLRFDFMNWMLNKRFEKLKRKSHISNAFDIAPLQLIDIDSLERLKPNLAAGDFRLDQCLNARAARDTELLSSFSTFPWKHFFPSFGERADLELSQRGIAVLERIRKDSFDE